MTKEGLPAPSERKESDDTWERTYSVTESKYPYAFYLKDGGAYLSVHFDGTQFRHPETKEVIDIKDFISEMKKDLATDVIVLSSCYPDAAKETLKDVPGITVIGTGTCETQTKYNNLMGTITVRSVNKQS